jgi:hypothetical protein
MKMVARSAKGATLMKYMLLMNNMTRSDVYAGVSGWQQQNIDAHIEFMKSVTSSLRQSGELLSTEGLEVPDHAVVVRAGANGEPVTDGVFPEAKEFLAGYWIVEVADAERAYQIAAHASSAPGPGGAPLQMPIEVRRIAPPPPEAR